jgi:flavin-binding protein dodecin
MSVAKVIEITAESTESFDDAVNKGIERTAETVSNIRSAWVKDQQVTVDGGKVAKYRVSLKITFIVGD